MNKKHPKSSKEFDVQDILNHKGIFALSRKWVKWAKNYINRSTRRKNKQMIKGEKYG